MRINEKKWPKSLLIKAFSNFSIAHIFNSFLRVFSAVLDFITQQVHVELRSEINLLARLNQLGALYKMGPATAAAMGPPGTPATCGGNTRNWRSGVSSIVVTPGVTTWAFSS